MTPDRAAGARLLASRGCDFLIMDDGFQSARIHMDYALLVVDGRRGVGNGHVIPGGPLRAPLVDQLRFAQAVLKIGDGEGADDIVRKASRAGRPVYEAHTELRDPGRFAGRRFLAFAGIGDPDEVLRLGGAGRRHGGGDAQLSRTIISSPATISTTLRPPRADKGLELVTTAKDAVRLRHGAAHEQAFAKNLDVLEIDVVFDLAHTPRAIIETTLASYRDRHHRG